MGIIECQLDDSYKKNEMEKELKMKEDDGSLCIIEYNKKKMFSNNKKDEILNEKKNNSKKNENLKIKISNSNKNEEDLIIITPRHNKLNSENYNNEITDEHTIRNETLVYNFENKNSKDKIEKEEYQNMRTQKMNNSKSFVTKRIVTKKQNINNKDIPKNKNIKIKIIIKI